MKYKYLNVKYALINATFMFLICASSSYGYNFLAQSGFEDSATGIIITLVSIIALIGQTVAGSLIDKYEQLTEKKFITMSMIATAVLGILMAFMPEGSIFLAIVVILGFTCASVGMPSFNAMAFIYEKDGQKINYGVGRGVGSCAYAIGSSVVGTLWGNFGKAILPWWVVGFAVLSVVLIQFMPNPSATAEKEGEQEEAASTSNMSYTAFFGKYKEMILVALAMILLYFCHMLINTYIAKVLANIMGTTEVESVQGTVLFIAAMCELPTMFLFSKLVEKFSIHKLMIFGSIVYSLKHVLTWLCGSVPMFYGVMVLQMFSYAILIPSGVYFANDVVEKEDKNKGQAVMSVTTTIGALLASFIGGQLFQYLSVSNVILVGVIASCIGTVFMVLGVKQIENAKKNKKVEG